ncbi:MAG: caspase family protein [Bacteroidia bacterium]|nr:caspase family protein [Bacteroidia bacterium]
MSRTSCTVSRIAAMIAALCFLPVAVLFSQQSVRLHLEEGKSGAVWDIVQSPDGKTLYSCGRDSSAKSWNLVTGECIRMFRPQPATLVTAIALDYTGTRLAAGDMNGTLTVWNARSGIRYFDIPAHRLYITDIAITPDGKSVLTAGRDGVLRRWSLDDGQELWTVQSGMRWIQSLATTPDGTMIAAGGQDGSVGLFRLSDGAREATIGRHARRVMALHVSDDGRYLFSGGAEGALHAYDLSTRSVYRQFTLDAGYAHSLHLDRMGEKLLVGSMNGLMEVWDWKKRLRSAKLPAASYGTMKSLFDADGKRLLSAHTDGTIRLWNMQDAALLLSMAGFSDGQWLSFTPDGYYDCSSFGDRYVTWRSGDDVYPIERYRDLYRRPGIIEDVLRGGYTPGTAQASFTLPPSVRLLSPRVQQLFVFGSEKLEVVVEAEARDIARIERVLVYFNGRLVNHDAFTDYDVIQKNDTLLRIRARIPVLPGRNSIDVVAVNATRVRSAAASAHITVLTTGQRNPDLYVLTVGADRYTPDYPDLQFASVDAESLKDELSRQEGGMYQRVYPKALTGNGTTKDNIVAALKEFRDITSRDVLVLFFSGHGVRQRDKSGKQRYYFLPAGTRRDKVSTQGLAWEDFTAELRKLNAGRVILLLDACHSGDVSAGASNEKVAAALAGEAGIVFTSSSGNEYSYEDPSWGHGAFTKALLDGLRGAADFTKDNVVDWSELQLYVSTSVRGLTKGSQNPMVPRLEQFANFDVVRIR